MPPSTTAPAATHGTNAGSRPARALLWTGGVITAISAASLLVILGLYFLGTGPHPSLYVAALWGFPVGFLLMVIYLLLSAGGRRRGASLG